MILERNFPYLSMKSKIAGGVVVEGSVYVKDGVIIRSNCHLIAETKKVVVEEDAVILDNCLIRNDSPDELRINTSCFIGQNTKVFASIGQHSVVEEDCEIRAQLGEGVWVRSGTVVEQNIPSGMVVDGELIRPISEEEEAMKVEIYAHALSQFS